MSPYQLYIHENGIPLEHLITCAQDVQIQYNEGTFHKQLQWKNDKSKMAANLEQNRSSSSSLAKAIDTNTSVLQTNKAKKINSNINDLFDLNTPNEPADDIFEESQRRINQFTHEVVELFKGIPRCIIPVSKFNNEYHKKYGRQCRVADYGYIKLMELLESIPHIIQIIDGEFEKKLTLIHRVQVRRFSNDIIKVLRAHPNRKMFADEFPSEYEKHFGRQFDIRDYGVCFLEDMLAELPDSIISRKELDNRTLIQIPKTIQIEEERLCTLKLANDIIDMLKPKPRFSIQFTKFIPSFHHHFGRQCKLSNYGFTKLFDLLEAMPDCVQLLIKDGVQFVQLKKDIQLNLICKNLVKIIEESECSLKLSIQRLEEIYNVKYEPIYYQDLGCSEFLQLLQILPFEKNFVSVKFLHNSNKCTVFKLFIFLKLFNLNRIFKRRVQFIELKFFLN